MQIKLALSVARAALVTVVTTAVLVGCSSPQLGGTGGSGGSVAGTGGAGGTGGGEPLEMFAADYQTGYCTALVACNVYPDLATCQAVEDFPDNYNLLNFISSVRRGTMAYDPVAAAACIATVSQDCFTTDLNWQAVTDKADLLGALQTRGACSGAFTGTVPLGGTCEYSSLECAAPNLCSQGCTGSCIASTPGPGYVAPNTLGQDCSNGGGCVLPAYCDGMTCVLPADHLASCTMQPGCKYLDDYCAPAAGATTTTCIPRLPPGSPCALGAGDFFGVPTDPCQQQAQCLGGVCVAHGQPGDACGANNDCYSAACSNGTCAAITHTPNPGLCPIPM